MSNLSKIVVVSNPIIVDNVFDPHVLNDKKTNINDSDSSYTNSPTVVGELADNIVETTPTTVGDIKFIPL